MYNRLQAIRAAVFGISFSFFCLMVGLVVHVSFTALLVACVGLALLTLCGTWIRLKPNSIYGGLHSFVWFVAMAICGVFSTPLPLGLSFLVSIILFVKINEILLFLYNLSSPISLFGSAGSMPKQAQAEPERPFNHAAGYQEGYQWQRPVGSYQEGEPAVPYQSHPDAQERMQMPYPEMYQ